MKAVLTAVIAAIEAAAVAVAVFAVVAIASVLVWWLVFDLAAEPEALAALAVAIWQLAHFVPMSVAVSAQTALNLGLAPETFSFEFSLAPLGLTLVTVLLAFRSGWRFAGRGSSGVGAVFGGTAGFAVAATAAALFSGAYAIWPEWAQIIVVTLTYAIPVALAFVVRAALDGQQWWQALVRSLLRLCERFAPTAVAALPQRAAETVRLAIAGLAAMLTLAALGVCVALIIGYVEIVTLSQGMHLDLFGTIMLFVLHLVLLPIAWIWGLAWFAGPGFSIGAATSVSPFEVLLGPLPSLPLLGAIPEAWGWAGALAPALLVAITTLLGGLAGGRDVLRRASVAVSIIIPVCASILVGLAAVVLCAVATGAIGPERLSVNGPSPWIVGGVVTLECAFGMSLGVFARRVDKDRLRFTASTVKPATEVTEITDATEVTEAIDATEVTDDAETQPIEPLRTQQRSPEVGEAEEGEADPLLHAFSWEHQKPQVPEKKSDEWRERLSAKLRKK